MRKSLSLLIMLFALSTQAQTNWPATNNTMKPWTRWWWIGSAITKNDITYNLEQYKKAGLGGVEITPIYGVVGKEKDFVPFLSKQWMDLFSFTLQKAKELGLGVDLANATGWPFGGPWVTDQDASKSLYYRKYEVNGGEKLKQKIEFKQEPLIRSASPKSIDITKVKNPPSANTNLQQLAIDQVQFPVYLPLKALVAFDGAGNYENVISELDKNGMLQWEAPKGKWTVYALFEGLHGKMVERAAPGGEGYAIDHFSSKAAQHYFKRFDSAFKNYDLSYLRGFFNDSYEVDDARGQADWTPELFEEFKRIKGYDLRTQLNALFGQSTPEKNARVLYDYRSVIDELILNNFTQEWKKWGSAKGKILRNQSHGSPANTLDLYSVVDIPETEGTNVSRFKFASSAGNVSGKKYVSSESATWLNEHFLSSWGDVKKAIDLYFLGGVNHIVYHGTAYSPEKAAWPGWLFYAAVHFQPTNPQWKDFDMMNQYITRVQSFLQNTQADNDILLYYPIVDRYSQTGGPLLQHFDGMEKNFENTDFEKITDWMYENGYGYDFFSDRQLTKFDQLKSKTLTGGNSYRAILIPTIKYMDVASLQKLITLAQKGATILVHSAMPKDVPGWYDIDARQEKFKSLIASLNFAQKGNTSVAKIGSGKFIISDDVTTLLNIAEARKTPFMDSDVHAISKKNAAGRLYFLDNRSNNKVDRWYEMNDGAKLFYTLYDAMTGKIAAPEKKISKDGKTSIRIALDPYATLLLQVSKLPVKTKPFVYSSAIVDSIAVNGKWSIDFIAGGPSLPAKSSMDTLNYWTVLSNPAYKNFSGSAKYSSSFSMPSSKANAWVLDLGILSATAEVFINGKPVGKSVGPTFKLDIPDGILKTDNTIDVIVSSLMANRIAYMDKNNIPWKTFYNINMSARLKENLKNGIFDASAWKPLPSGLQGPVKLIGYQVPAVK